VRVHVNESWSEGESKKTERRPLAVTTDYLRLLSFFLSPERNRVSQVPLVVSAGLGVLVVQVMIQIQKRYRLRVYQALSRGVVGDHAEVYDGSGLDC
jgi:hypothetical protein